MSACIRKISLLVLGVGLLASCSDQELREANERAAVAMEEGRPAEAVQILHSFGGQVQKSPVVLINLGRALLQVGETEKGLFELRHAARLLDNDDPNLLLLARIFLSYGEIGDADQLIERSTLEGTAEYHLLVGHLLFDVGGSPEDIAAELLEALRLKPGNKEAIDSLLILMEEIQDPQQLQDILAELPASIGETSGAQLLLGKAYARAGEWEEALNIAKDIVQSDGSNTDGWILMARAQAGQGKIQHARNSFRLAVSRGGADPRAAIAFGRFLIEQNRIQEAIRILGSVEHNLNARNPEGRTPALHNLLAAAYARQGQTVLAAQQLNQSLSLDPNQPEIRRILSRMNQQTN